MSTVIVRAGILYAWRGPSLLIVTNDGVSGAAEPLSGFYHREARFLSELRLTLNGTAPWLCECAAVQPDLLAFNFVYPELSAPGGGGTGQSDDEEHLDARGTPERALDIRLNYRVRVASLDVRIVVTNRSRREIRADLRCALAADFADLLESQSGTREQNASVERLTTASSLEFLYRHPQLPYRTELRFNNEWHADEQGLKATLSLQRQETRELAIEVVPHVPGCELSAEDVNAREAALETWATRFVRIEIPGNRLAERVISANVRDIASLPSLDGPPGEWLSMQAGMPLYPAFFGRDAVTAGWQAALLDRGTFLDAALTRLGRLQSDRDDEWRDEEPGRIPYQVRSGPLARLNLNPYSAYYADYASPLMYVVSLANLFAWTGDRERVRAHWDTARRILDWARERGDIDGDGYLEYHTRSSKGTKNQGWKDSGDAIIYDDGRPVPAPIATCELQGYWYIAQELMALLSTFMGAKDDALAHHAAAAALKERFNRDWWVREENFIALALDPTKQPVRAVTSNVGHCIATGIIDRDRLPAVVGRMFAPDMFSGWGIRTLASTHSYYDPLSYHRGTVWAVEQGTIVFGLRRFGFNARAMELTRALFDLAELYPDYRIPECVGGYARAERPVPGAYPRANTPQLWNATIFPLAVQALLGLVPLAPVHTLIVDPVLPEWMPHVVLRGLRVGDAQVTLRFERTAAGDTSWDVLHSQGTLRVIRQPPPESLSAGMADRVAGLIETVMK
jgi:glycogen debranching enzyme